MLNYVLCYLGTLKNDESGQGMVEYSLLVGLIAIVVIAALTLIGPKIGDTFNDIGDNL